MKFEVRVEGIKNAEKCSNACQNFPYEMLLRSGDFCMDPKSMLGVLAIFYSAQEPVILDTGDTMGDKDVQKLVESIKDYVRQKSNRATVSAKPQACGFCCVSSLS
jgi:phosphotransferase system HPr-like phosphotransfer protein